MTHRRAYLERIRIDRFGRFTDKVVGPFSPGLNVVFGANEAGKTTVSAFVKGVLFGWDDARGAKNVYKSQAGSRAGTLFFRERDADSVAARVFEYTRVRNADGPVYEPAETADLFADIDKETFSTMFALTSDELRGLSATNVTAKLLTAGSGTGCSPADALKQLDERIKTYTSRAGAADHSLVNLKAALDACRDRQAQLRAQADELRAEDREFAELEARRASLFSEIALLNEQLDDFSRRHARAEELLARHRSQTEELGRLAAQRREADAVMETYRANHPDVLTIPAVDERALRDRLAELAARKQTAEQQESTARQAHADAYSAEQALLDGEWARQTAHRIRRQRVRNRILAFVLPAIFLVAALAAFWQAAVAESVLSVALGVVLALASAGFGAAGLYLLFRPDGGSMDLDMRRREAHEKTLAAAAYCDACRAHREAVEADLREFLDSSGLSRAAGSPATARAMLDAAADMRETRHRYDDTVRRITAARETCMRESAEAATRYAELFAQVGIGPVLPSAPVAAEGGNPAPSSAPDPALIAALVESAGKAAARRDALQLAADDEGRRYGELKQRLAAGSHAAELDRIKVERAQLTTRFDESRSELACLLLARNMLADAVEAWEGKSQPEVYACASRLFELMTDGVWTQVRMGEDGNLTVKDAVHTVREPRFLSLGTCQQLYLAMRIALLLSAGNVGSSVPVLADDILVNFDDTRRRGAVKALAELARHRQVIVFTCHREVADLIAELAPDRTLVAL